MWEFLFDIKILIKNIFLFQKSSGRRHRKYREVKQRSRARRSLKSCQALSRLADRNLCFLLLMQILSKYYEMWDPI